MDIIGGSDLNKAWQAAQNQLQNRRSGLRWVGRFRLAEGARPMERASCTGLHEGCLRSTWESPALPGGAKGWQCLSCLLSMRCQEQGRLLRYA